VSRLFRDAVLELTKRHAFARTLVNSGRLSVPSVLRDSPLNTPDEDSFRGAMVPGAPVADAPVRVDGREDWFLRHVGDAFTLVHFAGASAPEVLRALAAESPVPLHLVLVAPAGARPEAPEGVAVLVDAEGLLAARLDAGPGTTYLLRPDQHVCARWRALDPTRVRAALARATGNA
jgi:3-(3-hydroxy-phenyl)propionate hydroxylase